MSRSEVSFGDKFNYALEEDKVGLQSEEVFSDIQEIEERVSKSFIAPNDFSSTAMDSGIACGGCSGTGSGSGSGGW